MSDSNKSELPTWDPKIDPPGALAYDPETYKELIQEVAKANADHDGWFLASFSPVLDEEMANFSRLMDNLNRSQETQDE